ncbi:MAG TPA: response regulator [Ktedonobacterales bacterium]|nr:response regulator [Ktedonobacterales bacterium]
MPKDVPTVLIVDDNPDLLTIFQRHLSEFEGFAVVTAVNGVDGLERFNETKPDCIVIDVKMPELDGYQMTRALRGDPASADLPLVILTALSQDVDRLRGILSGVDEFLVKPVKPSQLAQVLRTLLAQSAQERERHRNVMADAPNDLE